MPAADALERFRVAFGGRPLLLFLIVCALGLLLHRATRERLSHGLRPLLTFVAAGAIVAYAVLAIRYGLDPHYYDNAEPTMTAVGWLFAIGKPIYHDVSSPERYAHVYGPAAFMIQGWALRVFGPSIAVSKFVGVTAGLLSLAALYGALRRGISAHAALVATGVAALALLAFRNDSFWVRPDALQLLAATLLVLAAARFPPFLAVVVVGIATGVLWNLKITGPCYALPIFALLWARGQAAGAAAAAVIALAIGAAPFVLFSNVSWTSYVAWIRLSGDTGLLLLLLRQNVEWALFLSLPLVAAIASRTGPIAAPERAAVLGLLAGMAAVAVAGAKPGAGPYHMIAFIPAIAFLASRPGVMLPLSSAGRMTAASAFVVVLALQAVTSQALMMRAMGEHGGVSDAADVLAFARTHERVQMGYGETEALSFSRPLVVFSSGDYMIDQPAIREHQLQGLELPAAAVRALDDCRVRYWLIPKGEQPFAARNPYAAVLGRPLYRAPFLDSFHRRYARTGATAYFDVWECRSDGTGGRQ